MINNKQTMVVVTNYNQPVQGLKTAGNNATLLDNYAESTTADSPRIDDHNSSIDNTNKTEEHIHVPDNVDSPIIGDSEKNSPRWILSSSGNKIYPEEHISPPQFDYVNLHNISSGLTPDGNAIDNLNFNRCMKDENVQTNLLKDIRTIHIDNCTKNDPSNAKPSTSTYSTNDKQLFHPQKCEENTFWKLYIELEQQKYDQRGVKTFWQFLFYIIQWILKRTIHTAVELHSMSIESQKFWIFFLESTKYIGLTIFGFNALMVLLGFSWVIVWSFQSYVQQYGSSNKSTSLDDDFFRKHNINNSTYLYSSTETNDDNYNDVSNGLARLRLSFVMYMFSWLLVHICCFALYLVVYVKSACRENLYDVDTTLWEKLGHNIKDSDILNMWSLLTRSICISRLLQFLNVTFVTWLQPLLEGQNTSGICYGIDILPLMKQDYSQLAIVSIFDMYQALVLAFLPTPWPWMYRIAVIEMISALLKLTTCSYMLTDFPMKLNLLICVYLGLLVYYIFILAGSALYFENSMRSAYSNIQEQQIAATERQRLVNMLCREIKLPAQDVLQILVSLSSKKQSLVMTIGGIEVDTYLDTAKAFSSALHIIVDDFLLLVKVDEGRFKMHFNDAINIPDLFSHTVRVFLQSMKWPFRGIDRFVQFQHKRHNSLDMCYGEQSWLHVMFYQSILCLLALLCNDKLDDLPKIAAEYLSDGSTWDSLFCVSTVLMKKNSRKLRNIALDDRSILSDRNQALTLHVRIAIIPDNIIQLIKLQSGSSMNGCGMKYQGVFESSARICHKLATAGMGNWSVFQSHIEFSVSMYEEATKHDRRNMKLPFEFEKTISTTLTATMISPQKSTMESISSNRIQDMPDFPTLVSCKVLLQDVSTSNILVYLTDPSYETMIIEVLDLFFGSNHQIPIQNSISVADLRHYKLFIVLSIADCQEIRLQDSDVSIVLFSERLAYFDESEERLFDFSVPLPHTERSLINLAEYLYQTLRWSEFGEDISEESKYDKVGRGQLRHPRTMIQRLFSPKTYTTRGKRIGTFSAESTPKQASLQPRKTIKNQIKVFYAPFFGTEVLLLFWLIIIKFLRLCQEIYRLFRETLQWILHPVDDYRRESYTKWRTLSPIGAYGHHTIYLESMITVAMFCSVVFRLLSITSARTFGISIVVLGFFSSRRMIYNYCFRPFGISYTTMWIICSCINLFISIVTLLNEIVGWTDGKLHLVIVQTRQQNPTLMHYVMGSHGNTTGLQSLLFLILVPNYVRFQLEFFYWPYGYFSAFVVFLRGATVYLLYISPYLMKGQRPFIFIMMLLISLALGCYQYLIEKLNAQSFTTLYDLLIQKDFKDRLLIVANVTFTQPLQQLQELQSVLLESIGNQAYQNRVWITKDLHLKMSLFRSNIVLSKELLMQLRTAQPAFMKQERSVFLSSMKAKLVINLINKVCSHVLSGFTDLQVKIVFKLHPAIALIRVDEDLFSSLLGNICRRAIQEIRYRSGLHGLASADMTSQEIFLWIRPDDSTSSLGRGPAGGKKFTDIRTMLITAFDMCPNTKSTLSPMFPLCDRFMRYFGQSSLYISGNLEYCPQIFSHCNSLYKHYQQVAIPYLLCPDSYKLQNILGKIGFYSKLYLVESLHVKAYQIYRKFNIECIDEVDRLMDKFAFPFKSPTNRTNSPLNKHGKTSPISRESKGPSGHQSPSLIRGMQSLYKFTNSSKWSRKFTGNALIFCLDTSEHVARYLRSQEHFQSIGWACSSVVVRSINDIIWRLDSITKDGSHITTTNDIESNTENNPVSGGDSTAPYDAVIFDVDIEKVLSPKIERTVHPNNGDDHQYDIGDIKGLVHLFRSLLFTGLIAVNHPNPEKFTRSTGLRAFSRASYYVEQRQKLESYSPYSEAVSVDLHLTLPFTEVSAQQIAKMCEWNVYKRL